jgi:four helix bundle protein
MKGHHKLTVWQRSIDYVTKIYKLTEGFPKDELYALTSQMRRCAISVASNIAGGAARNSKREFKQFLSIAQGSVSELETQIIIAGKLGCITEIDGPIAELDEISRMIVGLRNKLQEPH